MPAHARTCPHKEIARYTPSKHTGPGCTMKKAEMNGLRHSGGLQMLAIKTRVLEDTTRLNVAIGTRRDTQGFKP